MQKVNQILFIGLGVMGNPMANNLVASGKYKITVYDLDSAKAENLICNGAYWTEDLVKSIAEADLVMTSLPGPVQVEAVAFSDGGLFQNMRSGSCWIDLSTNNQSVCKKIVETADEKAINFLDSPVSGGDEGARAGSLTILVGGKQEIFDQYRSVLEIIGENITLLGPSGAGYAAKIAQVVLCYVHSLALSEAMMLGVKGGVDTRQMLSIIQNSTGKSYVADRYGPPILNGDYDPSFTVGLALKDMKLAMEMADSLGIRLPICELTTETYEQARETYGFDSNHLKAVRLLEEENDAFLQT